MRGAPGDEAMLLAEMLGDARHVPPPRAVPAPAAHQPPGWRIGIVVIAVLALLLVAGVVLGRFGEAWSPTVQTAAMSAVMAGLAIAAGRGAPVALAVTGTAAGRWSAIGVATGGGGIAWCASALWLGDRLSATTEPAGMIAWWGVAVTLMQVGGEELLFRGAIQPAIGRVVPPLAAVPTTAALFALLHLPGAWNTPVSILNVFLAGCWLGLLAERSGGVIAPIAAHWGWNAGEVNVLGLFPNPGTGPWGALWGHDIVGTAIWGGGAEGLNASFLATFTLAGMCLIVLAMRRTGAA